MWEHLDIWLLLAGLGIFLFGIRLIEDSIAKLGGRGFKRMVREGTSTTARAIISGTAATAILQSSSAVTLMVLAFVGAGVVSLTGGIGIILGSNIGTTATSWIVATLGFKLDIEELALPLIGIGGLVLIFLGHSIRYSQISHLLVGFGFLFLGLDNMKDSVAAFAGHIDPALLVNASPWQFIVLGLVLTALMQSSSATVAILLTGLYAGLFDLREGALAIIGTNIGTTVTVFLGALGGTMVKKRLAWSHLTFNLFAGSLALLALPVYLRLVVAVLGEGADPVLGLALFHTLFNLIGVLVLMPFTGRFSAFIERLVPEKEERLTLYIGETATEIPEAAVAGVQKEVRRLLLETIAFHAVLFDIDPRLLLPADARPMDHSNEEDHLDRYEALKRLQAEIITYVMQVEKQELSEAESQALNRAVHAARLSMYAAKALKDVKRNVDAFSESGGMLGSIYDRSRKRVMNSHLRLVRIMEDNGKEGMTTELAALLRVLEQDDQQGMQEVSDAGRSGQLRHVDLSTALLVNRALVRASHDLVLAVAELTLPVDELRTLERIQEVEDALQERSPELTGKSPNT